MCLLNAFFILYMPFMQINYSDIKFLKFFCFFQRYIIMLHNEQELNLWEKEILSRNTRCILLHKSLRYLGTSIITRGDY